MRHNQASLRPGGCPLHISSQSIVSILIPCRRCLLTGRLLKCQGGFPELASKMILKDGSWTSVSGNGILTEVMYIEGLSQSEPKLTCGRLHLVDCGANHLLLRWHVFSTCAARYPSHYLATNHLSAFQRVYRTLAGPLPSERPCLLWICRNR